MRLYRVLGSEGDQKIHYAPEGFSIALCGQYVRSSRVEELMSVNCKACEQKAEKLELHRKSVQRSAGLKLRERPDLPPAG